MFLLSINLMRTLLNMLTFFVLRHIDTSLSHCRCFLSYRRQPRRGAFLFSLHLRRKGYRLWRGRGPKLKPSHFPSCLTPLSQCPMHYALAARSCAPSHDCMVFDTDSIPILIDSGASYCMTNDQRDFIDNPIPITTNIQGLGDSQATM